MEIESKTVKLRFVEPKDAEFIYSLRTDKKYNTHLSQIEGGVEEQRNWIIGYKKREEQGLEYYFVIERLDGTPCGTVRIYDLRDNSFCWGRWILNEDKTRYSAIESALLVYKFGFDVIKFESSHFDARKENDKVVAFHKKMGAIQRGEDEQNYYYTISKSSVDNSRQRFAKFIS